MTEHQENQSTRQRLLEAACEVFAAKGYRDATIAEICERASANVAAVNYHFGDKERLYAEAWRHAFQVAVAAFPCDGGLPPHATPQERLRAHIAAVIYRIFNEGKIGYFPRVMHSEMGTPTLEIKQIIDETIRPQRENLQGIVRALLGEGPSEKQVHFCGMSIMSQCHSFAFHRHVRKFFEQEDPYQDDLDSLIDHITAFSLAGIAAIREKFSEENRS
jgi:AcrR family transcriptional regulator